MKKGTQPTPASRKATRSFGWRSKTPPLTSAVDQTHHQATLHMPEMDRSLIAADRQRLPIGGECERFDAVGLCGKSGASCAGLQVPEHDRAVAGTGSQYAAVIGECNC